MTRKATRDLKIGDTIYIKQYGDIIAKQKIIRITATMAKSKDYNFDKELWFNNLVHIKGNDKWTHRTGYLETPELKEELRKKLISNWFSTRNFNDEEKEQVYNLLVKDKQDD